MNYPYTPVLVSRTGGTGRGDRPQASGNLVSALNNPQALVSDEARVALPEAASAFPGGEAVVDEVVNVAHVALSGSIHDGFVFILVAVGASILAALAMKNVRLEGGPGAVSPAPTGRAAAETAAVPPVPVPEPSVVPRLAEAFGRDEARNGRDEALRGLLSSVNGMSEPAERRRASDALLGLAERIEHGNGDYPNLLRAAGLANGHGGTERGRAAHASRTVVRPLGEKLRGGSDTRTPRPFPSTSPVSQRPPDRSFRTTHQARRHVSMLV